MDIISSIIAATISVIILIVFFQMNIKLSSINEELKQLRMSILERDREHAKVAYFTGVALKNNSMIIENLTYIIIFRLLDKKLSSSDREKLYNKLKEEHGKKFIELGMQFPKNPLAV